MVEVRKPTEEDINYVADNAREADVLELWASDLATPLHCILQGTMAEGEAWAGLIDGKTVCIFGVVDRANGIGVPWMVGTPDIEAAAITFARGSYAVTRAMFKRWSYLTNWVDARNCHAIRWLRFLGFTIHEPEPYGKLGMLFHPFEMRS